MSQKPDGSTEVVDIAELRGDTPVIQFNATNAAIAELGRLCAEAKGLDLKTEEGMSAAKDLRNKLVSLRVRLEERRIELKKPALEFGRSLDAAAAELKSTIVMLEAPLDAAITAEQRRVAEEKDKKRQADQAARDAERQRVEVRENLIRELDSMPGHATRWSLAQFDEAIEKIEAHRGREWQEFKERGIAAVDRCLEALRMMREQRAQMEEQQTRLEASRLEAERRAAIHKFASDVGLLVGMPSTAIASHLAKVRKSTPTIETFGLLANEAMEAQQAAITSLETMLADTERREQLEADSARQEQQRQAEQRQRDLSQSRRDAAVKTLSPKLMTIVERIAALPVFVELPQDLQDSITSALHDIQKVK